MPDVRWKHHPERAPREGLVRGRGDVLAVIAVGGAVGSTARYGISLLLPHPPDHVAWSTVTVNLTGAFLLGLLMVFVNEVWRPNRYVRPFLGVGVLGGYTTFSTYVLDAHALAAAGRVEPLAGYVLVTLLGGLSAVWAGEALGRLLLRGPRRPRQAERQEGQ
jgi:CrcB protein